MAKSGLDFVPIEIGATDSDPKLFVLLGRADEPDREYCKWVRIHELIYA